MGPRQWIRLEPWTKLLSPRIFAKLIPRIYHQLFTHNFQTRIFEFSRLHWGGAKVLVSPAQTRSLIHRTKNAAIKYPSSYPRAPSSIPAESLCIDAPRISRGNIATRTLFPSYESLIILPRLLLTFQIVHDRPRENSRKSRRSRSRDGGSF